MFFNRIKQKEKVIEQYGANADALFTMFMTYNRVIIQKNEEQKESFLKEFFTNISNKYGEELATLFYKEFMPKHQGSSLVKELSNEGQRYINASLCLHHHTHPTTFPLIEKILKNYTENEGKKYLSLLYTSRKFNKTLGEMKLDYYTFNQMQNLFTYNAIQEFGKDIFDKILDLLKEYGKNEFLYDELDEQNELGFYKWFLNKLIPFEIQKYF